MLPKCPKLVIFNDFVKCLMIGYLCAMYIKETEIIDPIKGSCSEYNIL